MNNQEKTSINHKQHNNHGKCRDIFHEYCGKHITKYNYLGDLFIFFNILILLYILITGKINYDLAIKILLILLPKFLLARII